MAKAKAKTSADTAANLGFEAKLWLTADKLGNNVDAAEDKHDVLGLIFLKYISDAFEERHQRRGYEYILTQCAIAEGQNSGQVVLVTVCGPPPEDQSLPSRSNPAFCSPPLGDGHNSANGCLVSVAEEAFVLTEQ